MLETEYKNLARLTIEPSGLEDKIQDEIGRTQARTISLDSLSAKEQAKRIRKSAFAFWGNDVSTGKPQVIVVGPQLSTNNQAVLDKAKRTLRAIGKRAISQVEREGILAPKTAEELREEMGLGVGVSAPAQPTRGLTRFVPRRESTASAKNRNTPKSKWFGNLEPKRVLAPSLAKAFATGVVVVGGHVLSGCNFVSRGADAEIPVVVPAARNIEPTASSSLSEESQQSAEPTDAAAVLERIKKEKGVVVPTEVSSTYSEVLYRINENKEREIIGENPNAVLTKNEAEVVEDILSQIPAGGYLIQLIIPQRLDEELFAPIPVASLLGYNWPVFINRPNYGDFPRDRLVTDDVAIKLLLPENVDMYEDLPSIDQLIERYPYFTDSYRKEAEIPWTTHAEKLKQSVAHESGHSLINKVRLAMADGDIERYFELQGISLFNEVSVDVDNPIFVEFAKVNGWIKVPFGEYVFEYMKKFYPDKINQLDSAQLEAGDKMVWARDPKIWNNLLDRDFYLTYHATYGPIQEAFSDYWMISILYPDLLTKEEQDFFFKIHEGLEENPEEYINTIATTGQF